MTIKNNQIRVKELNTLERLHLLKKYKRTKIMKIVEISIF